MKTKIFFGLLIASLPFSSIQAKVVNKTQKTLNICELRAVFFAAKSENLYEGPNEATADLLKLEETARENGKIKYSVTLQVVDDGDVAVNEEPKTLAATAYVNEFNRCDLPGTRALIIENAPTLCPAYKFEEAVDCNEKMSYMTQSVSIEDYEKKDELADAETSAKLISDAKSRLGDRIDATNGGAFFTYTVQRSQYHPALIAVLWLDIDDNSYSVFYDKTSQEFVYSHYEN